MFSFRKSDMFWVSKDCKYPTTKRKVLLGPRTAGVDIIVTTLPRWGFGGGGGGGGAVEPGGSDDGMTITITISSGSSGKDDSELQAIVAKCVKK